MDERTKQNMTDKGLALVLFLIFNRDNREKIFAVLKHFYKTNSPVFI